MLKRSKQTEGTVLKNKSQRVAERNLRKPRIAPGQETTHKRYTRRGKRGRQRVLTGGSGSSRKLAQRRENPNPGERLGIDQVESSFKCLRGIGKPHLDGIKLPVTGRGLTGARDCEVHQGMKAGGEGPTQ